LNPSVYILNHERPKPIVIARDSAGDLISSGFSFIGSPAHMRHGFPFGKPR
jgi:hypothetical protein